MTCAEVSEQLTAFVDGELTDTEKAAVDAHLPGCAVCQAQVAALRTAIGTLASLPALEPSRGFEEAVLAALRPTRGLRGRRPHWAGRVAVALVASGAVAAAIFVLPKLGLHGASTAELAMAAELDLLQDYDAVAASDALRSAEDVEVVAALDQLIPPGGQR